MPSLRRFALASSLVGALGCAGTAQAASIWSPVATGTTQGITAAVWPSQNEILLTTSGGSILRYTGSAFTPAVVTGSPVSFADIATSPDGVTAVAVGAGGAIYRSADSGQHWASIAAQPPEPTSYCPTPGSTTAPLADQLDSVAFADSGTVYVTGENNDVLKSTDGGVTFTEVNKSASACKVNPGGSGSAITDTVWTSATHGYLLGNDFGKVFETFDGLSTGPLAAKNGSSEAANGYVGNDRFAFDASGGRFWATNPGASNASYFQYSTDSATSFNTPTYDGNQVSLRDVAYAGGTVIATGSGGDIYTSADGRTFNRMIADAPNNTTDWKAVAILDATHALVAGAGGTLVMTSQANQVPDTAPPTGTIAGPATLATSQFGTYTVSAADNPGGSGIDPASYSWSATGASGTQPGTTAHFAFGTPGPQTITVAFKDLAGNSGQASFTVTVATPSVTPPPPGHPPAPAPGPSGSKPTTSSTGGGTVTIFKVVTVTGRKGRFIPVKVKTSRARRFVITVLTIKGHHHRGLAYKTFKHGGSATVRVGISSKVKPGKYLIVVRVFTLGRHPKPLGRQITVAFILA